MDMDFGDQLVTMDGTEQEKYLLVEKMKTAPESISLEEARILVADYLNYLSQEYRGSDRDMKYLVSFNTWEDYLWKHLRILQPQGLIATMMYSLGLFRLLEGELCINEENLLSASSV